MAAELKRPLTVRVQADATAEDIVRSVFRQVEENQVRCVCPTIPGTWQITLRSEQARETLLDNGLTVGNSFVEVTPLSTPPAFVTVKMPCEMSDQVITSHLVNHGTIAWVNHRTYRFAPNIETGVRVFKVLSPRGQIPDVITSGRFTLRLYVRYGGQAPACFRCGRHDHLIRDCPTPPGGTRRTETDTVPTPQRPRRQSPVSRMEDIDGDTNESNDDTIDLPDDVNLVTQEDATNLPLPEKGELQSSPPDKKDEDEDDEAEDADIDEDEDEDEELEQTTTEGKCQNPPVCSSPIRKKSRTETRLPPSINSPTLSQCPTSRHQTPELTSQTHAPSRQTKSASEARHRHREHGGSQL